MRREGEETNTGDLRILPYGPSDLDELMEIEFESFTAPWSRKSYEELAALENVDIWVARLGRELVGYMLIQYMDDDAELHTFAVKRGLRRRGIGRRLMDHMLSEADRRKVRRIYLQVRPSNDAAAALYDKLGFKIVGIRPAYYHDNKEDALVMRLDL